MQCICSCFVSSLFEEILIQSSSKPIHCLICHHELTDKCMICTSCNLLIGHVSCVNKWIQRRRTCPNCIKEII